MSDTRIEDALALLKTAKGGINDAIRILESDPDPEGWHVLTDQPSFVFRSEPSIESIGFEFKDIGVITGVHLRFDITLGNWRDTGEPRELYNLFHLCQKGHKFLFGYGNVLKQHTQRIQHFRFGYGMKHGDKPKLKRSFPWREQTTYTINLTNLFDGEVTFTVMEGGTVSSTLSATSDVTPVSVDFGNDKLRLNLGFTSDRGNPYEPASWGWTWRNLYLAVRSA